MLTYKSINMGQPVTITLYVSAEDLYNVSPQPTRNQQAELDAYCILGDNNDLSRGKPDPGGGLNTFTSQIYSDKQVTWVGQNIKNDGYRVLVDEISSDAPFFTTNPLTGNGGRVVGTPKEGINNVIDTYTIKFYIDPPGGQPQSGPYYLDPKLGGNDDE